MDDRLLFCGIIGFCVGIWLFFTGFKKLRRKRRVENVPTSTVRGMALGLVELIGKGTIPKPYLSPLSKKKCVYFSYLVERYVRRGKHSYWETIVKGSSSSSPFWLKDGTGTVLVLPQNAEMMVPISFQYQTGPFSGSLPDSLGQFLVHNNISRAGFLGIGYTLRFREWAIGIDDDVYVMGTAKKIRHAFQSHRDKLLKRLKEIKRDPEKMKRFDTNNDGQISPQEWDQAVKKIETEMIEESLKAGEQPIANETDLMIGQGDEEKLFMISTYSQKELINKLGWQAFGGVIGGAILSVLCLAGILFYVFNEF